MAVNTQKLLPQSRSNLVVAKTTKLQVSSIPSFAKNNTQEKIEDIKSKVIEIDKLLKGSVVKSKKIIDEKKKQEASEKRTKKEEQLEAKDTKDTKKKPGLKMPKISFFDRIKNFIKNIVFGFIVTRLVDFAPQITRFISFVGPIADFVLEWGGKLLNGLVTFVDWGYKVYDSARGFIGDKLGDQALKNFDSLMANVNTMLNLSLIAAMGAMALRPKAPKVEPKAKARPRKPTTKAARKRYQRRFGARATKARFKGKVRPNIFQKGFGAVSGFFGNIGKSIASKYKAAESAVVGSVKTLGDAAKKRLVNGVISPIKKLIEPLTKPLLKIKDKILQKIASIPGLNSLLKKIGMNTLGDAPKMASKLGAKALPVVGGVFNLLFAYDRLAQGDSLGALIEFISAILDFSGAGAPVSMALDAFMFARDMFPQIRDAEEGLLDGLGLGGVIQTLNNTTKKLPDLSSIVKILTGKGDPSQPMVSLPKGSDEMGTREGMGPGSGVTATGVTGKGLRTGPSSRIGGSAEYHVDTKFHKSLGMGGIISAMDKLSQEYASRGRVIEMSGGSVAGRKYDHNADPDQKKSLMEGAFYAHSHSSFMRAEGFLPFDYYIPKADDPKGRFGKSAEGAEILLPDFGGKMNIGKLYGGYGKSADIYDASNKWVAMTGHGDTAYMLGGFTKAMAHRAILGEKGREFVMDADSTAAIEKEFPGLLSAINSAKGPKAIDALRQYASYDMPEVIPVPVPQPVPVQTNNQYDSPKNYVSTLVSKASNLFKDVLYMR